MKQELKDAYWRRLVAGEHFSPFVMDGLKKAGVVPKPGSNTSATTPSGREPPKGEAISNYEDLLKQGLTAEQARILEEFRDEGLREMAQGIAHPETAKLSELNSVAGRVGNIDELLKRAPRI